MKLYVKLDWITNIHIFFFLISWNLANDVRRISCLVCPQNLFHSLLSFCNFFCCRREEEKEKLELKVKLNQRRLQLNLCQKRSLSGSILKEILKNAFWRLPRWPVISRWKKSREKRNKARLVWMIWIGYIYKERGICVRGSFEGVKWPQIKK